MGYQQNRLVLYFVYIASFVIMAIDIILFPTVEQELFYIAANGMVIFRLLGVWLLPWLIHVGCSIYLVYYFAFVKWEFTNFFNTVLTSIVVYIVFITALHLVFFRPGRNVNQRACRAGIHALTGVILIFNFYWMVVFLICDDNEQGVVEMIYFLLFLFMLLNPKFIEKSQIAAIAQVEADAEGEIEEARGESRQESRREPRRESDRHERLLQHPNDGGQTSRPEGGQGYAGVQGPRNRR